MVRPSVRPSVLSSKCINLRLDRAILSKSLLNSSRNLKRKHQMARLFGCLFDRRSVPRNARPVILTNIVRRIPSRPLCSRRSCICNCNQHNSKSSHRPFENLLSMHRLIRMLGDTRRMNYGPTLQYMRHRMFPFASTRPIDSPEVICTAENSRSS